MSVRAYLRASTKEHCLRRASLPHPRVGARFVRCRCAMTQRLRHSGHQAARRISSTCARLLLQALPTLVARSRRTHDNGRVEICSRSWEPLPPLKSNSLSAQRLQRMSQNLLAAMFRSVVPDQRHSRLPPAYKPSNGRFTSAHGDGSMWRSSGGVASQDADFGASARGEWGR
jgi:hypothetical protein